MGSLYALSSFFFAAAHPLLFLFPKTMGLSDLSFVSCLGFFCSIFGRLRGFCVSALFLLAAGIWGHAWGSGGHGIRFAFESFFLCAFWIAAAASESEEALRRQREGERALLLQQGQDQEQEACRSRQAMREEAALAAREQAALRKDFDALQAEKNAIETLNDVLRKENAVLFNQVRKNSEPVPEAVPVSFAAHRTPLPGGKSFGGETLRESLLPKRKKKS